MGGYIHQNQLKYIKAPTIEMIDKVIEAHGVNEKQFGRFYGFYETCIQQIRKRKRQLPVHHWHVIYESLRLIEDGKPLSVYRDEQPQPSESSFKINIPSFITPKKKKKPKRKTIKRTGTLCELC